MPKKALLGYMEKPPHIIIPKNRCDSATNATTSLEPQKPWHLEEKGVAK